MRGLLRRPRAGGAARTRPIFFREIVIAGGEELRDALLGQGLDPDEVVLKYCWPRYAPRPEDGIRSISKSENLGMQFERLVAMHRVVPSSVPLPAAIVRSTEGEFAGYILEYVGGESLQTLIARGTVDAAREQLAIVEEVVEKLHAKSLPHGDINPSNVVVADDGRTLLIDPVANPGTGAALQDRICLDQIGQQIDARADELRSETLRP